MSIAQALSPVVSFFMQECPLCGRSNKMVVQGIYREKPEDNTFQKYPDIGYSFCNCKNIFYTNFENVKDFKVPGFNNFEKPLDELRRVYTSMPKGDFLIIVMPDPFFCEWDTDPYKFEHWNPRKNYIIWDMDVFCEEAVNVGFEIINTKRQFDVQSANPKTMEIVLKKP